MKSRVVRRVGHQGGDILLRKFRRYHKTLNDSWNAHVQEPTTSSVDLGNESRFMNDPEEMEQNHQDILKGLRKNIVDDVDVFNGIIHPLVSEYILKESDVVFIKNGASKEDRVGKLLDILPRRGSMAFDTFHQALRHHYPWLGETMDKMLESNVANDMGYYIGSPNIPPVSPLTVTRVEKTKQLKNALKKLEPGCYIAIHGMKGFGKSSLTASTLKDSKLIKDLFGNKIYWIKFGHERPIDEEILIQLNFLCHLVKNVVEIILPNSSKSEFLKESLIQFLRNHFNNQENRNSLLILDDVCNKKIIEVFDFNCKTLVITADIDVLYGKSRTVVEMSDGFTEMETLGLFAKVLEIEINKLPLEAKRIHEECKGMPLLIAMFAAQFEEFKDDMRISNRRWKYYLDCLRKKDPSNNVMEKFFQIQEAIFDVCINQLDSTLKKLYQELVIFSEDVNITPLTLEILWEGKTFEIEEKMLTLCHKSLAAKQWNAGLKSYVYGVHDLLLCHLRNKNNNLINAHKSFVEKYRKYCNNDFSKLPEDNYSYSYIGHHLEQAQMYKEFPNLYLNLDFIEKKILHNGLSDLLIDLKKYRKHITNDNDPNYETKVTDLEKFIQERASILSEHRRKKCLDITQIALNHGYNGFISEQGKNLATERKKYLYLTHKEKSMYPNISPMSEEVSTEDISVSAFTDDYDKILIGNKYGEILLWNCTDKNIIYSTFHNIKEPIKKILLSHDGQSFLSLSEDGSVKLFKLRRHEDELPTLHSPKQKQIWWRGLFVDNENRDDSSLNLTIDHELILDVIFSHDDKLIAGCTNKGTIEIWDLFGISTTHITNMKNSCLRSIAFTDQSVLLHAMDEANGLLITYGKSGTDYNYISQFNPNLEGKKIIYFHDIPGNDNSLIIVTESKAIYVKWIRLQNGQIHSYKTQTRADMENENARYECAALTYDGQYLILAGTDGFINLWKVDLGEYQPRATYKTRVNSLDSYWFPEDGYHVICGSENRLLHRWKIPGGENEKSFKTLAFDALLKSQTTVIAKESTTNTIIILNDNEIIAETEPATSKIVTLSLSDCGNKVIYSTESGIINLYEIGNKKTWQIMNFQLATDFIKFLTIDKNDIIVCRESNEQLKVWHNTKVAYSVETAGRVIAIHTVTNKHVITVTENGFITIWKIVGTQWSLLNKIQTNGDIFTSDLSYLKTYCIVLTKNRQLVVYKLWENEFDLYFKFDDYTESLTTSAICQSEKYMAVGLKNGEISIIDLNKRQLVNKFTFHTSAINQLSWAPRDIDSSILLSVTNDDIVWWNVDLIDREQIQTKRKSRMGYSVSTPSFDTIERYNDYSLPSSLSMNDNIKKLDKKYSDYWKSKIAKYSGQSNLLAIVKLPPTCNPKVYTSQDFSEFLTIDINGSINNFQLFQYP